MLASVVNVFRRIGAVIGGFRRNPRVIALAPGLAGSKVDLVLAQEAPNILNINVAQVLGQKRTGPPGIAVRRRLIPEAPKCACSWLCRRSAVYSNAADR